ncbi:hypothetical protein [Deminuibacter soli]|uniref:Uncharacterized protein n=1 Tax=Deminuibacter soli TaxID=2291815 RepID=A0A3E1NJV6_9BACT|nr:hypothetical protein [Deminuibacter soli]RFM28210.1 hypothetical protein DXN05_11865 [Deminuibacter soli]
MWKKWICSLIVVSLLNVLTCFPGMHFPGNPACAAVAGQQQVKGHTFSLIGFILNNLNDESDDTGGTHFHYSIFTVQKRAAGEQQAQHLLPVTALPVLLPRNIKAALPPAHSSGAVLSLHYNYLFRLTPF